MKSRMVLVLAAGALLSGCTGDPNLARIFLNAEPQGTKVYKDGRFFGRTPVTQYNQIWLADEDYTAGEKVLEFVFVHDGYLPKKEEVHLKLDPEDRLPTGKCHRYYNLTLLERDPNAPKVVIPQGATGSGAPSFSFGISVTKILVPRR
jgi:hypothetical protein